MDGTTRGEGQLNVIFWQKIPSALAKVSSLFGAVAADGQYLRKFPGIAVLLPLIVFAFGLFCGGTHFYVDQPLYMSVIPMVGFFVLISFISGGLGLATILGYAVGYLLFFDHLVIVRDIYHAQAMRDYGSWIYAGIFFNLLIFFFLPTVPLMARAVSLKAATQLVGDARPIRHFCLYSLTKVLMTALFMMVWVQMVTLGAFSYYLWWDRGYDVWDFTQFIQVDLWGMHPLVWVALVGVILRMAAEMIIAVLPGETVRVPALPSPFKLYQKIPLSLKSILAALLMFMILQGYMADVRGYWFNLAAGLIVLYLLRDGIEIWLHKWFSLIERVPLAYRLLILFAVMGYCADHLTEYLHYHFFRGTPEPHILGIAITLCLPIAFLLVSKNEPHRDRPPPRAPFWLKPLMALLRKIRIPQALRKRFTKAVPTLLLIAVFGFATSAAAHHCFQGCDSCDYFTRLFNWIAGGTTGILGILLSLFGGGDNGNNNNEGNKTPPKQDLLPKETGNEAPQKDTPPTFDKNGKPTQISQEDWDAEMQRLHDLEQEGIQPIYPESWLLAGSTAGKIGQKAVPKILEKVRNYIASKSIKIDTKISDQVKKRGWSEKEIQNTIQKSEKTVKTQDIRWKSDGSGRNNDPATAYIKKDGHYVVRNDKTGDIVQISDKNKPNWKSPY